MSLQSQHSLKFDLQRSEHHGSGGISSTPGDQRDTGSGFSIIKVIPDKDNLPEDEDGWKYRIHCFRQIGKGGFGVVYLGKKYYENRITKDKGYTTPEYAIKVLEYSNDKEKESQVKRVFDIENKVLVSLKKLNGAHNKEYNIVKAHHIIHDESANVGYIVTEYCSGGDLAHYLKSECSGERVTESEAKNIMVQVTKGKPKFVEFIYRKIGPTGVKGGFFCPPII